ncbi:MBL fold metallo-hydrolase [Granulosicoccus sp. 3-233]|uniref:MBL fold metallo-hydrolase n=1 Tax=Granulosicoccus sp. 3-233 TaxID=3417969 RepID=UPI003D341555
MRDRSKEGLWAWKQSENNNRMIALQSEEQSQEAGTKTIKLAYFGGSCFRITTPAGLSLMIDPWRNPPWGGWDWYLYDFPRCEVDIGLSTHAHFDHDNLHSLHASTLIDRLVGRFEFADAVISGIADKHVSDSTHGVYDWAGLTRKLTAMETVPPDNWRSFDNSILVIETAGLRILHWGDNRPNPPQAVWDALGKIDIALLPIDGSQHVLSYEQVAQVRDRLNARITIPHHYFVWNVTHRASTLLPPDEWMASQSNAHYTDAGEILLSVEQVRSTDSQALCFGEKVCFDPAAELARKSVAAGA